MNDIKKNELNETEMEGVTGGIKYDFLHYTGFPEIWETLTPAEQNLVIDQSDDRARRNKMLEIWMSKRAQAHESGASGGW